MSVIVLAASLIHFASIGRQRRLLLFSLKRVVPYRQIVCLYTHELEGFFGISWFFIFLIGGGTQTSPFASLAGLRSIYMLVCNPSSSPAISLAQILAGNWSEVSC